MRLEPREIINGVPRKISASMTTTIMECKRKFQYKYIDELITPPFDTSAMDFGTHFHHAMALLDTFGRDKPDSLARALEGALEGYQGQSQYSRWSLVQAIVWETEKYKNDEFVVIKNKEGKPMIEVPFEIESPFEVDGKKVIFVGRLDAVVRSPNGSIYIKDYKTTKTTIPATQNYWGKMELGVQMVFYANLGRHLKIGTVDGVLIEAVQTAVNFARFERHRLIFSEDQLNEFEESLQFEMALLHSCASREQYPRNFAANCNYCNYNSLCKVPRLSRPGLMDMLFRGDQDA